jgi:DNA-binding PadR family transcriptional regulator
MKNHATIHGYDLRRELETWHAESWANIAYGSIYFALNKMAEEGLVEMVSTDQPTRRPARTLYCITEKGQTEFMRLLREFWSELKPIYDPFQVALTFMDSLSKEELITYLRRRYDHLAALLELSSRPDSPKLVDPGAPRHIYENIRLAIMHMQTELNWLEETIEKVERGELP